MARPYILAHGDIAAATANDGGDFIDVPLPYHQADDIIVVVCNYFPYPNAASAPSPPSGFAASSGTVYSNADRVSAANSMMIWWWARATSSATPSPRIIRPDPTGAAASGTHLSASAFVVRNCITYGDPFEGRTNSGDWTSLAGPVDAPAVSSTHTEALAILVVTATHHGVTPAGSNAGGFVTQSSKYAYVGEGSATVVMSRGVEIGTIPAGPSGYAINDPLEGFNAGTVFGFVAIPTETVDVAIQPVTAVPVRGPGPKSKFKAVLGCSDEYEAIITSNDYDTRIDAIRWSSISWDRSLDEISSAKVAIPDEFGGVACIAKHGGLKPWRYGLTIERNGSEIWKGPITKVGRSGGIITVDANDALVRFRKRLATRTNSLRYVANDAGQMFADLLNIHGRVPTDAFEFLVPQPNVGVAITRNIVAREFNYTWDVIDDLLNSAIDAYVLAGCPVVFQPGVGWIYVGALGQQYSLNTEQALAVSTGGDTLYGLFTAESFAAIPDWTINGMVQANTAVVPGADSGQAGFRKYWSSQIADDLVLDSVLDMVETSSLYRPGEGEEEPDESVFQRRADGIVALRAIAPVVIDAVELAPSAPINVENLRPGSIWLMDVYDAGWGQLLGAGRVKRVTGEITTDSAERISVSLQPLGYTEGDL